jgi:hypothetical protein
MFWVLRTLVQLLPDEVACGLTANSSQTVDQVLAENLCLGVNLDTQHPERQILEDMLLKVRGFLGLTVFRWCETSRSGLTRVYKECFLLSASQKIYSCYRRLTKESVLMLILTNATL